MTITPPFCPNRDCPTHYDPPEAGQLWFLRKGCRPTKVVGPVPRFQCRVCRKGFSSRTFDVDYWTHRTVDYAVVQHLLVGGSGLRQSCRTLGVSTRLLANRHVRLCRQALAMQAQSLEDFRLKEAMVFDGFESFAYSQYYPNNLHLLVTSDSQFVLGLNGVVMRRKGRMTEKQKRRRTEIEQSYRAPSDGIYRSCKELLAYGCHMSFGSLLLPIEFRTDERREYGWALKHITPYEGWKDEGLIVHTTVSSKAARTLGNPLFPVNYLDRQLRKDLAEHVRESVRFARRLEHSLERAAIHLAHHNFFKVFRSRSQDHRLTHAEMAGLERNRIQDLRERSFRERALGWRVNLEEWQQKLWRRETGVLIHPVTPLARHLLTA